MANEMTVSISVANSSLGTSKRYTKQYDQTTKRRAAVTLAVGTSEETWAVPGDVATPGLAIVENKGANPVKIGSATGSYLAEVQPGHAAAFDLAVTTLYLIAIGGSSDLDIEVYAE